MNFKYIALASLTALSLASCSTDDYTELERAKSAFTDLLGGNISTMQWWRTAVTLNIKVDTPASSQIWLMSGNDKGELYDYRKIDSSGNIKMLAPQGRGNTLYLVTVCKRQKQVSSITLTGKMEENVNLEIKPSDAENNNGLFDTQTSHNATQVLADNESRSNASPTLYGKSIKGNAAYKQLSDIQKDEALLVLKHAYKEYVPAKSLGANCDYELLSKGNFDITWFAGSSTSQTPHVLGYYYHTPGTYDDITYVDISETEIYDYIDGLAKVQYKVDDAAASQYGVLADHWYDANFDMYDTFDRKPLIAARQDDDAYNSIAVFNRYGNNITALRGISFNIDVPAGMCVGFYDRIENVAQPEQYDRFVKLGIKPYTSRDKFKAMNFSCEAMNMNLNGSYRSCVFKTDNAIWLGMENDYTGGDLDCNDVMFEVSADLEIHQPSIVEPDLKPFAEYDSIMPWTIAYEDIARNADFDFNDAVIKVTPNPEKGKCLVTAMAAGSTSKMFLHYDGPDGDQNLGELHSLLGDNSNTIINTTSVVPQARFVDVAEVAWPEGYTMEQDAHRFYIEIQRGTCSDCSDVITLAEESGKTPEALLVAGEWKWPLEGINVTNAYPSFAGWSRDVTQIKFWNWYANPKADTCVNY